MQYANLSQNPWSQFLQSVPSMMRYSMNQNPEMGWGVFSALQGNAYDPYYTNWLSSQYSKAYNEYLFRAMLDPTYQWTEHLGTVNPARDYTTVSPRDRGVWWSSNAPTMRMMR